MGVVGSAAGALAVMVAAFVLAKGRASRSARRVSVLLALEGVAVVGGNGAIYLTDDAASVYAWQAMCVLAMLALPSAYLALIGTLDTPLSRPLRRRGASIALTALALAGFAGFHARPRSFVEGVGPGAFSPLDGVFGPAFFGLATVLLACAAYGLVASLHAVRVSNGSAARQRAKWYAAAFGVRDVSAIVGFGLYAAWPVWSAIGPSISLLAWLPLLAYGILRTQLFDIDLRLKWTLRRGTLVGAFVAVFVVVAAFAEQWLRQYGVLVGGVAAAAMLLALRQLERAADRLADVAMPRVRDTADYRLVRKREVYRAAVESALQDGIVTERERDVLATLAHELGLSTVDARAIEREAATSGPPA